MKKLSLVFLSIFAVTLLFAQEETKEEKEGYKFETVKEVKTSTVKNQYRSGTCWSFSTLSFIEAEILRNGGEEVDLSEMWVVRHVYSDKAKRHVRMHGHFNFGGGGALNDPFDMMEKYGLVPEEAYAGLEYGEGNHVHGEFDEVLSNYVEAVIENKNRKLSTAWHEGFNGILDAYLGETPETFEYNGKTYTPREFTDEVVNLNHDDYVYLTSFTHHPFYEKFIVEVPDNWSWNKFNNVPLDELIEIMDNAIDNGYSIGWASDVSEKGFSWKNGVAIVPEIQTEELAGSEKEKWEKMTEKERKERMFSFDEPVPEKTVTQEMRQEAFDNYQTTDDHGMHIVGIAKDQDGTEYYKVKNSWDNKNVYKGYFYVSKPFVRYKTMSIVVHKDALPKNIAKKLNLE
ncbi:MAG: aminopeptidase [Salinivirgaceae bacterium]|jgi:bleomycin hydrolase|nr:aminopeptidase [Salinivirgaceae bacterium]